MARALLISALLLSACAQGAEPAAKPEEPAADDWAQTAREQMVQTVANYSPNIRVTDAKVLDAMRRVPRHKFVPDAMVPFAYADRPLPIGEDQTISQPLIVGYMTEALQLTDGDKVLEIGTGSGYQAAILSLLAKEVYTIEIVGSLGRRSKDLLKRLGYKNVHVRIGDGYRGWPEKAPFDAVIVTCSPDHIPGPLVEQLRVGGLMMIPVEGDLILVRKTKNGMERKKKMDVRFVPMTGEAERRR